MIRQIIEIDKEKCNGCGLCADACHEGAIGIIDGKAELLRDDYCDGLGNCLPVCPTGAISFVEREAAAFDEEAAAKNQSRRAVPPVSGGCPGKQARTIKRKAENFASAPVFAGSQLAQWPCQIRLVPVNAPYFDGAKLLVAADCTAYAYASLHSEYMKSKITLIGCPKLDDTDYSEKLTEIISRNDIQSVTVVRMEVPCCGGLEATVKQALQNSGKFIPWSVVTVSTDGNILQ